MGNLVFVIFQIYELGVTVSMFQFFMVQQSLNVFYLLGSVVLHCSFPVPKRVKLYLHKSRVLQYFCYASSLFVSVLPSIAFDKTIKTLELFQSIFLFNHQY